MLRVCQVFRRSRAIIVPHQPSCSLATVNHDFPDARADIANTPAMRETMRTRRQNLNSTQRTRCPDLISGDTKGGVVGGTVEGVSFGGRPDDVLLHYLGQGGAAVDRKYQLR